jgi:hypothetical protein
MDCEVDGFGSNETAEELGLVVGPLEGKLPWFGVDTDQGPYEKSLISEAAVAAVKRALQVIPDGGVRVRKLIKPPPKRARATGPPVSIFCRGRFRVVPFVSKVMVSELFPN